MSDDTIKLGKRAISDFYQRNDNANAYYTEVPLSSVQTSHAAYLGTVTALRQAGLMK